MTITSAGGYMQAYNYGDVLTVACEKQKDAEKGKKLVQFLRWMMHEGQGYAGELRYASLPKDLVTKEEQALRRISDTAGKPLLAD